MRKIYRVSAGDAKPDRLVVAGVANELCAGGLALLPTETVYGVGVSVAAFAGGDPALAELPAPDSGYRRIFSLKHRDLSQTVPWLVGGADALDAYGVGVDPRARALAEAFWPGALTIVVRASDAVPPFMQAADGTVALRASASPVILELVRACASPLAVTSANTHGHPAPAAFSDVEPRILDGVDAAVDAGATRCRDASTIVSFASGELEILRQGALPAEKIHEALGRGEGRPPAAASPVPDDPTRPVTEDNC